MASKPCQFGENEAVDVATLDVGEHPPCLRVLHNRFSTDSGEVVYFSYIPALCGRIISTAIFMMLRTFALGLIFGRNPNPNANILGLLGRKTIVLHSTTSYQKARSEFKQIVIQNA